MNRTPKDKDHLGLLRASAEAILARAEHDGLALSMVRDLESALHELSVYQIELEMQNEQLQHTQQQLQQARDEYQSLYNQAPNGYLTLDEHGIIRRHNATFVTLMNKGEQNFCGTPLVNLIDPQDRELWLGRFSTFYKNPQGKNLDIRINRPDKRLRWLRLTGSRDLSAEPAQGKTNRLLVAASDITREMLAEQEKLRTELQLLQAEKLQSIGTLAGGIAHDFNNILAALSGNISLARLKLAKEHIVQKYLQSAGESIQRATQLTNQLLTFSKGGAPVCNSLDLKGLLEEVVRFNLAGSAIRPQFLWDENLWPVYADQEQLHTVFEQLTSNARQAMPNGGHLLIEAGNINLGECSIPGLPAGSYLHIQVTDNGVGISPEHLPRIFDPYFSPQKAGKGLGLATVYSIIKRHGGKIMVSSQPGHGTSFNIYLPATEKQRQLESEAELEVFSSVENAHVLLMDDEEAICLATGAMLEELGHRVVIARDGQEAIEAFCRAREAGKAFDLVIMDLTVPGGMGGKEAIAEILKIDKTACVLVSSGYADDPVMANYREYGFCGVIAKPYTFNTLATALGQAIKNPHLRNYRMDIV
ncbi:MAG: response regulator [Deltaproteobacteria bacterium]|nr:response regulator [Deltaproteobacteria bacterium]